MKKIMYFMLTLALLVGLMGCNSSRVFEENINLPDNLWNQNNVLTYKIDRPIDTTPHNIYYMIRHSADYPYQNIFIKLDISDSKGQQIYTKVHDIPIAEETTGKPLGDGLGDIFDLDVLILENFRFVGSGSYTIKLSPQMRAENIAALGTIGVFIEKEAPDPKAIRAKESVAAY